MPANINVISPSIWHRGFVVRRPAFWGVFPLLLGLLSLALGAWAPGYQDPGTVDFGPQINLGP